ncbi:mechanosensitive ion channel family protein [Alkalicoccus halolimnae]|uniref:Mechanosensitive ion channel domain-containing protein n=1 Tax=Alkalicoccus halolimnae TaxID=1667239 RepID=A0A5C7F967_9BACI|nr:mechanosensitive ion channel domain-containing protein [Alkalicoccus halolimnae]TXF86150.1 mechanosensitive ion channel [Alkalicoccus halolimnae]
MTRFINYITEDPFIATFIIAAVGVMLLLVLMRILKKTLGRYVKDDDNWYRTRKAVNVFGFLLIAIFLAVLYSDMLGGITVVLGVASAGIAFSLREVIASIAGWLTILVGGMFGTGDRVRLGGVTGDVIDIGVLRTTIMETGDWVDADLYNGRIVKIANSFVFTSPVYNYSTDFPFLWDEITLPIKFGSDYTFTREMIRSTAEREIGMYREETEEYWNRMVRKFIIEDAKTDPMVTLSVNDNWVEFTLRYVVDYKSRRKTKDILFTSILEQIEANPGKTSLTSASFELASLPRVDVQLYQKDKN